MREIGEDPHPLTLNFGEGRYPLARRREEGTTAEGEPRPSAAEAPASGTPGTPSDSSSSPTATSAWANQGKEERGALAKSSVGEAISSLESPSYEAVIAPLQVVRNRPSSNESQLPSVYWHGNQIQFSTELDSAIRPAGRPSKASGSADDGRSQTIQGRKGSRNAPRMVGKQGAENAPAKAPTPHPMFQRFTPVEPLDRPSRLDPRPANHPNEPTNGSQRWLQFQRKAQLKGQIREVNEKLQRAEQGIGRVLVVGEQHKASQKLKNQPNYYS
ncbi:hypothetical protein U1Q18_027394 [Sarracenia purpurea var. burkii]